MIRLKELREKSNIEQKTLAIDLHVSQPTISDWESGKKMPAIENVLRLADYFHVSVDYLLYRCDNPNNNFLASDRAFISRIAEALCLDADSFSAMVSEMSAEDIEIFLTPSVYIPAMSRYRLKRARFSAGLRQEDLANKLGISCNQYCEYESGKRVLTRDVLIDIARELNVSSDWLCCTVKYVDPQTKKTFDPGIYKLLVDSAYDPIDLKLNIFEIHSPVENQDQSAVLSLLSMYLRLDPYDQIEIRGEIRAFLKAEKYSLQEESKLA